MNILQISGSNRSNSTNLALLDHFAELLGRENCTYFNIDQLPAFHPDMQGQTPPQMVAVWKNKLRASDALIISSPEYLHNIPATLKNSLEWLADTGELKDKFVVPMVFTPAEPRGEKAMESLLWTLRAMEAKVLWFLLLHHSNFRRKSTQLIFDGDGADILESTSMQLKAAFP